MKQKTKTKKIDRRTDGGRRGEEQTDKAGQDETKGKRQAKGELVIIITKKNYAC